MTLVERAKSVHTREDLEDLVKALIVDLKDNPGAWENADLDSFLDAMLACVRTMESYYRNVGESLEELPPWRILADLLMASRIYE